MKQNATFDSSFWINADRAGLLPHVLSTYTLYYAPQVAAELDPLFPSGREFQRQMRAGAIREVTPAGGPMQEFGPGERAAINVALEHRDWLLLLDDQRPFQAAMSLGLRVLCTPVLAVGLFTAGELDARQALVSLARLAALQTVSPHLITAALAQLGKSLGSATTDSERGRNHGRQETDRIG